MFAHWIERRLPIAKRDVTSLTVTSSGLLGDDVGKKPARRIETKEGFWWAQRESIVIKKLILGCEVCGGVKSDWFSFDLTAGACGWFYYPESIVGDEGRSTDGMPCRLSYHLLRLYVCWWGDQLSADACYGETCVQAQGRVGRHMAEPFPWHSRCRATRAPQSLLVDSAEATSTSRWGDQSLACLTFWKYIVLTRLGHLTTSLRLAD